MTLEEFSISAGIPRFCQTLASAIFVLSAILASVPIVNAQLNLDTSFAGGVTDDNTAVVVTKPLSDGKILVGGFFHIVNGERKNNLVRLNADGSLDLAFNAGNEGPNGIVTDVVALSSGKFLIGGSFTTYNGIAHGGIVRINADGTLDQTFDPGGAGVTSGRVQSIAVQPDGKIIFSGSIFTYNGVERYGVVRLNADGTLDQTFARPFSSSTTVEEIEVQPDGKILCVGDFLVSNGGVTHRSFTRLNQDGTHDRTFNQSGFGASDGYGVAALALQPDGKILVGGSFQTFNGVARPGLARLNQDGTLDAGFVPNISFNTATKGADSIAVQPDGKVLVAGSLINTGSGVGLIRLNTDGTLDDAFALYATDGAGVHVAVQADNKILFSGNFFALANQARRFFVRFNRDGTLDDGFQPIFSTFGTINAIAQQPDGKIVVAGNFNLANGLRRAKIARFNQDGSLDPTFNPGNGPDPSASNGLRLINDIAVQPDGKIIVVGSFRGFNNVVRNTIARLNADGSLDQTFNAENILRHFFFGTNGHDVLLQPDGKILLGGAFYSETGRSFLLRLNADGTYDTTFSNSLNDTVRITLRQPDGKYLVGGAFTLYGTQPRNRIARLNADGSLDTTFNQAGGFDSTVFDLSLQPDGKVIAVGSFTSFNGVARNRVARLNADGSLDSTFNPGGGADNTVQTILRTADGKIIIGGSFSAYNGAAINRLAVLRADGSLDSSFVSGFNNDPLIFVRRLQTQSDGRLLIGGAFRAFNNVARNSLLRLTVTRPTRFDFDGDGRADFAVFRSGVWYVQRSQAGFFAVQFGLSEDKIAPADFDGDGKTDVAVFRNGNWYVLNSSNNAFRAVQWGASGDVALPADYDGDELADFAVFRSGVWYILNSSNNQFRTVNFGLAADKPVPADYDGDGRADIAVFRDGNWYWTNSSNNQFQAFQFGIVGDRAVPADYDGDGRADFAVFRNGVWYVQRSSTGFYGIQFGIAGDVPVPADYDGDGRADPAVFRNGVWYVLFSGNNQFSGFQFGVTNDQPVPAAFVP